MPKPAPAPETEVFVNGQNLGRFRFETTDPTWGPIFSLFLPTTGTLERVRVWGPGGHATRAEGREPTEAIAAGTIRPLSNSGLSTERSSTAPEPARPFASRPWPKVWTVAIASRRAGLDTVAQTGPVR